MGPVQNVQKWENRKAFYFILCQIENPASIACNRYRVV